MFMTYVLWLAIQMVLSYAAGALVVGFAAALSNMRRGRGVDWEGVGMVAREQRTQIQRS